MDEAGHQLAVERIARGEWGRISFLVMPPGYHSLLELFSLPTGANLLGSALLLAGLLAMVAIWHGMPGRRHLYLLAFCAWLFLLPHTLVEVR